MSDGCRSAGNGLHLDARKRVNYSLGLVLGEEEFRQDQLHLRERDQLANRALHGYGTISGLALAVDGNEVTVGPGLALDAAGRFVCVPSAQCADVGVWLAKHEDEVSAALGSPPELPAAVSLYVRLCYLECETDRVPLPLEPCRTGEDSMVASRVSESFELSFSLTEPVPVGEVAGGAMEDAIDDLVAAAQPDDASPPDQVSVGVTEDAIHDWAVEGRPAADGTACLDAPADACVPLGRIVVPVAAGPDGALSVAGAVAVDDAGRPVVASTRFLQEWLTRLTASEKVEPFLVSLDDLADVDTGGTAEGDLLTFQGGQWVPVPAPPPVSGVTEHSELGGLKADDHKQYFLTDGTRQLGGDVNGGGFKLRKLGDATDSQDAVTLAQIAGVMRNGDVASGDLAGAYPAPTVARLMSRPIADLTPDPGDALVWNGDFWAPAAVEAPERRAEVLLPLATITRLGFSEAVERVTYEIWFNVDAPTNDVAVEKMGDDALRVREEFLGAGFLRTIKHEVVDQPTRNVFVVALDREPKNGLLRFDFRLEELVTSDGASLEESAAERSVAFEGQARGIVTKFVRIQLPTRPE